MRSSAAILLLPLLLLSAGCQTAQQTPMACVLIGTKTVAPNGATVTKGVYVEVDNPLEILEAILAATAINPKSNETTHLPSGSGIAPAASH